MAIRQVLKMGHLQLASPSLPVQDFSKTILRPLIDDMNDTMNEVVQHEVDHLNGILYPERVRDMKKFGFEEELSSRIWPEDL